MLEWIDVMRRLGITPRALHSIQAIFYLKQSNLILVLATGYQSAGVVNRKLALIL